MLAVEEEQTPCNEIRGGRGEGHTKFFIVCIIKTVKFYFQLSSQNTTSVYKTDLEVTVDTDRTWGAF